MTIGAPPWPQKVEQIHAQLRRQGVWHIITDNTGEARSCREAAQKRRRLGAIGIPLSDELKTHLGSYESPEGRKYVAVHCRAHHNRDDAKVSALVNAPVGRVDKVELEDVFGMEYGRVNPFELSHRSDTMQLIDQRVVATYPAPNTMMTNAGDLCWGIEFHPEQLVNHMVNAQVADVIATIGDYHFRDPILGILTGNGPESGIELWRRINAAVIEATEKPLRGDTNLPTVVVNSVPGMGLSMQLADRENEVRDVVLGGIDKLIEAGASFIGVACNTTQYFSAEIREQCAANDVTFVSLVDATREELRNRGVNEFALFGIGSVVDLDRWSDFRRLDSEFTVRIPNGRDTATINRLAFMIKSMPARGEGDAVGQLKKLLSTSTMSDTAVIALTEFSVLCAKHSTVETTLAKSGIALVDTLDALADAMASCYIRGRTKRNPS